MNRQDDAKRNICSVIEKGDILIIVPPFVTTRTPVFGPHILQAVAVELGFKVEILYANLFLASIIGIDRYESISYGQPFRLLGERLFSRSAFGLPPLGKSPELCSFPTESVFGNSREFPLEEFEYKYYKTVDFDPDSLFEIEKICTSFIDEACQAVASLGYTIVGCSSNWEQNNCCIALIDRLKNLQPDIITLMGGSNCEGQMAEGIASLSQSIDYIFSGESETTFADFLDAFAEGHLPQSQIIESRPVEDLDNLPMPDYDCYFKQLKALFGESFPKSIAIGCETSRGCWYGKCSFCGLNGKRVHFRKKTVNKAISELEYISERYPGKSIMLIDKVMPDYYQKELLPLLNHMDNIAPITCEHLPKLDINQLRSLKNAHVDILKVGIESLSTGQLELMKKGVTASDNILLLRNAALFGLYVDWNLLWGFPGDKVEHYEEMLSLLPQLRHLCPPVVFRHISIDRFSPYFERAKDFAVEELRPWKAYHTIYPDWADVDKVAYRFIGDYQSGAHDHPAIVREIANQVEIWKKSFKNARLLMVPFQDYYFIYDSRIENNVKKHMLDFERAQDIMTGGNYTESDNLQWALEEKLGVVVDSRYIPLVTAMPELFYLFDPKRDRVET